MDDTQFCIYAVDDDDDDRFLIQKTLETYSDCEVTFFEDGEALIANLVNSPEKNLPTLILLDLDMPRLDGYETLETIRTHSTLRAIPILILSGNRNEEIVRRAYELGANSFMSKPSSIAELDSLFNVTYDYWLKTAHTPRNP
ncbi:response regulator [Spirosoma spitsbergense]|uniref:response regulator n=1 Tax=Spirosoma spitsbergense TaxID=431554 RepID=UPI0004777F2F|nr:response regulator [Spirosoma spitsbergense]